MARILSQKPRRGGRRLALRQGPLRLRTPQGRRPDLGPAAPGAPPGLRAGLLGEALDEAERGLKEAGGPVVVAFSGGETVETATAISRLVKEGLGGGSALLPDTFHPALDRFRAPISAIRDADVCLVFGDEPVVERAPVLDLWLRAARRARRRGHHPEPGGLRRTPARKRRLGGRRAAGRKPCRGARATPSAASTRQSASRSSGRRTTPRAERTRSPWRRASATRRPSTSSRARPNGRGVAAAWGDPRNRPRGRDRRAHRLRRRGRRKPGRPRPRRAREVRDHDGDVRVRGNALVAPGPPGHELPRARRDDGEPRGPAAAPAARGRASAPRTSSPSSPGSPAASASRSTPGPRCCPTTTPRCRRRRNRTRRGGAQSGRPETWAGPRARALPVPLQRAGGRARRSSSSSSARLMRSSSPTRTRRLAGSPPAPR